MRAAKAAPSSVLYGPKPSPCPRVLCPPQKVCCMPSWVSQGQQTSSRAKETKAWTQTLQQGQLGPLSPSHVSAHLRFVSGRYSAADAAGSHHAAPGKSHRPSRASCGAAVWASLAHAHPDSPASRCLGQQLHPWGHICIPMSSWGSEEVSPRKSQEVTWLLPLEEPAPSAALSAALALLGS